MKKVYLSVLFLLSLFSFVNGQLAFTTPYFPKETDAGVVIRMDASKGNQGLYGHDPNDVYIHIAAITTANPTVGSWRYIKFGWGTANPAAKLVSQGNNVWIYTLTGASMRDFFGITDPNEHILKLAMVFRDAVGTNATVQRNADGNDIYLPVYDATLQARVSRPFRQPTFNPIIEPISKNVNDTVLLEARSNITANLKIFFNGTQLTSGSNTSISTIATITLGGNQRIIAEAENSGVVKRDTVDFYVNVPVVTAPLPAGVTDGINYSSDATKATLVLYAPNKGTVSVIGDFTNWQQNAAYQMNRTPDGNRYWIELSGLTAGTEYAYQYVIDGSLKVADYNAEKVLDPNNDPYITNVTYPNLKTYPTGLTIGIVSVLQTAKPQYTWSNTTFTRPDKRNLIMYELLVRDFVYRHDWKGLTDTLTYLKGLGVNSIHVMPFNEFEGNSSWGYNPSFFLAPDKYYGPENDLRRFIDSAHAKGIAVLMDIVMNHAYGQSPMVQMYFANGNPSSNSPWFNTTAPHTWLTFGYDFNHEAQATKDYVAKVIRHWLTKYRLDGFRWDFTKGFSQRSAPTEGQSAAYDASRIAILKRIYDTMQAASPGSICVLEHFCANQEEKELSDYGMLLWGNLNYNYSGAARGALAESDFNWGIYKSRGWNNPTLLTYAESHDEERLMYRNLNEGNYAGTYDIRNVDTALKRQQMIAAFLLPVPGPKLIWQFGELGYDYGINRCENGSYDNGCRTSPKPIAWNYLQNANRKALYDVYANLIKLRNNPAYFNAFISSNVTWDLTSSLKYIKVIGPSLSLMIVGNFNVGEESGTVTFPSGGTWYSYLTGRTFAATGGPQSITLRAGEFHVYTNINIPLPLDLLSFTGRKGTGGNLFTWTTSNEKGVKNFELQRSEDGKSYTTIQTIVATNGSQVRQYDYTDKDAIALNAQAPLYYRLKMNDADGKSNYSKVVLINSSKNETAVLIYPNPVVSGTLSAQIAGNTNEATELQIQDMSGRVCSKQSIRVVNSGAVSVAIDVSKLATGMYRLVVMSAGVPSVSKLFAIQR